MDWIKIETKADLPQIKGSAFCWAIYKGRVELTLYQSGYFQVRAEHGLFPWNLISHYQLVPTPAPPEI